MSFSDLEFIALVAEMRSSWLSNSALSNTADVADLNAKYLAALRRALPTNNPNEREFFLSQISFIANSKMPPEPAPDWPAALRPLHDTYKSQLQTLSNSAQAVKSEARKANAARLIAFVEARETKPETAAEGQRLRVIIDELAKLSEPPDADWLKSRLETLAAPPAASRLAPLGGAR